MEKDSHDTFSLYILDEGLKKSTSRKIVTISIGLCITRFDMQYIMAFHSFVRWTKSSK